MSIYTGQITGLHKYSMLVLPYVIYAQQLCSIGAGRPLLYLGIWFLKWNVSDNSFRRFIYQWR